MCDWLDLKILESQVIVPKTSLDADLNINSNDAMVQVDEH